MVKWVITEGLQKCVLRKMITVINEQGNGVFGAELKVAVSCMDPRDEYELHGCQG